MPARAGLTRRRVMLLGLAGAASALGLVACQPARLVRRNPSRRLVLRINLYGSAAYAPLLQMRERRLLEEAIPGLSVEWKVISSAEAVNEALRDGGLDIATGPPPALLLAREAGLPARILAGISALPCAIVGRSGLRSLAALRPGDRIAVAEVNSLESSVLQLAALRELGDARALGPYVTLRGAADAVQALKQGKELAAHVAVTPSLELDLEGTGTETLVDCRDLFGGLPTAALAYALPALHESGAPLTEAFSETLREAARLAMADPVGTARLLSETTELQLAPERLGAILERSGWQLGGPLAGVTRIAELWQRTDRLHQTSTSWSDLAFDGVSGG